MEKESGTGSGSGLFVNDGSFMERFKQIQQQNEKEKGKGKGESTKSGVNVSQTSSSPKVVISRPNVEVKAIESRKIIPVASSGKLAFSLKQKSKLVAAPIKLGEDEDDYDNEDQRVNENTSRNVPSKRYKFGDHDASQSLRQVDVVPAVPSDPTVKNVADKLASFVAKNGREFENITRQKNPGDTPFKFLFDKSCSEYKYYEYCLNKEEKAVSQTQQQHLHGNVGTTITSHVKYQIPSSALYEAPAPVVVSSGSSSGSGSGSGGPASNDPIAMMEYYVKKAAAEERIRPPKASKGEMPPPASLQAPTSHGGKRGHHMGDYIPLEELEKFMATCNDKTSEKYAKALADKNKIQADNVGHKLLSKMGWKEGEGLGSSRKGIADPIMSGDVKKNHLGVGAHQPGEVVPEDDIYEQYKKRMMLGYRHRPNPLGNPRKSYY